MQENLFNKNVVIIGATGGIGAGFARAFAERGAHLLLAGRNEEKLKLVANQLPGTIATAVVDVTDRVSVEKLADYARSWAGSLDIVVNATGFDVRKALEDHSENDINSLLDINLLGAILLTRAFLPLMKNEAGSTIVHVGGFADGRLAFPYYSVDVASRAGVFSFIESVNRELELEGKKPRVTYFSPAPAETEAEKPYHPLWKKMGVKIVPVEEVAGELIRTIQKRQTTGIMGGFSTVFFARLNAVSPKLADVLLMRKYGKILKEFFYGAEGR